jgi:hypothetical protein
VEQSHAKHTLSVAWLQIKDSIEKRVEFYW